MTLPDLPATHAQSDLQRSGYIRLQHPGCQAVVLDWAAAAVSQALRCGTLHDWAAGQRCREALCGRGIIYAVDLPTLPATPVVVRRNRHGGLLGRLTGEWFLNPTRAPFELATALRLAAAGIPTPQVIAYAVYPVAGVCARSDVMTRRLPAGNDLPAAWKDADTSERDLMLIAVARLLQALNRAGAWHADLNLKNIYLSRSGSELTACLLDVDRVTFPAGCDIAARNLNRLVRSARKWRTRWELDFDEVALKRLADLAGEHN